MRQDADEKIEKYDIRPANNCLKTANFSGGNQQKIVLAREIERDPDILLIGRNPRRRRCWRDFEFIGIVGLLKCAMLGKRFCLSLPS